MTWKKGTSPLITSTRILPLHCPSIHSTFSTVLVRSPKKRSPAQKDRRPQVTQKHQYSFCSVGGSGGTSIGRYGTNNINYIT
eukprot:775394-Amphidinium_carterae.1